ncbi:FecCD family ABC transporter permease [Streptomyces sp. NPDC058372]|uniref:FecCD family ABC transporter permease n=1 Tax=Streptomyces sp. NPDC058372 TaxID=3346464 RepID=UPI0036492C85
MKTATPAAPPPTAPAAAPAALARVRPAGHTSLRLGPVSLLIPVRAGVTAAVLAGVLAVVCVAYLSVGEAFVAPGSVVDVLLGRPSPDTLVVGELRLPRMVAGLYVGAAFGIAGALVQTVARNPLASPDLIGVSQGASAATVAAMTFGVTSYAVLPWISVGGGLLAALLVYVFAWRGGLQATRFVLVGIGFAVALRALTTLFLTKGDHTVAQQAQVWMSGSLNGRAWPEAALVGWTLLAAVPALVWAARAQRTVTLDDATATALGARLGRARLGLVLTGVVLASVATGAAGPVDFVALLAPQIARRLARTAQIPLVCSALAGAVTVVAADLLARRLFAPTELPVGVLTAAVGAPYLIWLLVTRHGPRATGGTR